MLPQAEQLLDKAAHGERLTTKERRHCISYNTVKFPEISNVSMASTFQVSERQIRLDKKFIREERAKLIKEDDIGLVIADIHQSFELQVNDIEKGKKSCKVGSRDYLEYCKAIFNLRLQTVKALQELGYYPKNLGSMTVDKYIYTAEVAKDGSVTSGRGPGLQTVQPEPEVLEAEFVEQKTLPPGTN
jgi:hypothetical protein